MQKNMKKTNVSITLLAKNAEKYQENKRQYITGQKCRKISRKQMSEHHWPKMLKNIKKAYVSTTSLAKNAEKYRENKRQYNITGQKCRKI
jgi:Tfp pilus assembly protein PilV